MLQRKISRGISPTMNIARLVIKLVSAVFSWNSFIALRQNENIGICLFVVVISYALRRGSIIQVFNNFGPKISHF